MNSVNPIDTAKLGQILREKSVDRERKAIRVAQLSGSEQAHDLSLPPNCEGFGRIHHFKQEQDPNWVPNPLPTLPACKYLNIPNQDVLKSQVFQLAACDFRCWYCFVDYKLLAADDKHSQLVRPKRLLEMMLEEQVDSQVIDLSGGQPELVPEYILWFLEARRELGIEKDYFVWADDNLSTDNLWKYLTEEEISFMSSVPGFARVGCLKGFDQDSFSFNTGAEPERFEDQIRILSSLVRTGFDQYGYITLTTWNIEQLESKITRLMDRIQEEVHPNFPLRIVPLRIFSFYANKSRFQVEAEQNQFKALDVWLQELEKRFSKDTFNLPITEVDIGGSNG